MDSQFEDIVCSICMSNILEPDDLAEETQIKKFDLKTKLFEKMCKRYKNNHRMKTPCNHFYHTSCLLRWMEIKMECPRCRSVLPQIQY